MKKLTAVLSLAVLLTSAVFAQEAAVTEAQNEAVTLSIDEAVEYAIKNSRTLKSADIDLEIKKRASSNSWNVFLPSVSVNGTMSRSNNSNYDSVVSSVQQAMTWGSGSVATKPMAEAAVKSMGYEDNETAHWTTLGSLSASWNFTPAYIAQIKIAKANYEAGLISWEQNLNETKMNIKKLYYGILLQQESLNIQKATLENARRRMIQAKTNYENGTIPKLSYLQTQVSYENTKPSVDSAEQALRQNIDTFAFLIGLPVGTEINFTSSIEPSYVKADADELLSKYSHNDLSIRNLEKNIEAAKLGIKALDLSTWIPVLAVNYSYQDIYTGVDAFKFAGDIGDGEKWADSGSLSFTLAWNLTNMLPWSSNRQQVKDTKAQLEKAKLGLETLKENQKVQVRKAVDTLNQAKDQIDAMGRNVTLAAEAYDMTYTQYMKGMAELLDLRDAETSLNQAKLGLLNQKFQYISALMDLENTLNVKLTENKE